MNTDQPVSSVSPFFTSPIEEFIEARHRDEEQKAMDIIGHNLTELKVRDAMNVGGQMLAELAELWDEMLDHQIECRCNGNNLFIRERKDGNVSYIGKYRADRCSFILAIACNYSDHADFNAEWDIYAEWHSVAE